MCSVYSIPRNYSKAKRNTSLPTQQLTHRPDARFSQPPARRRRGQGPTSERTCHAPPGPSRPSQSATHLSSKCRTKSKCRPSRSYPRPSPWQPEGESRDGVHTGFATKADGTTATLLSSRAATALLSLRRAAPSQAKPSRPARGRVPDVPDAPDVCVRPWGRRQ